MKPSAPRRERMKPARIGIEGGDRQMRAKRIAAERAPQENGQSALNAHRVYYFRHFRGRVTKPPRLTLLT
jgi:hypothetical protein